MLNKKTDSELNHHATFKGDIKIELTQSFGKTNENKADDNQETKFRSDLAPSGDCKITYRMKSYFELSLQSFIFLVSNFW